MIAHNQSLPNWPAPVSRLVCNVHQGKEEEKEEETGEKTSLSPLFAGRKLSCFLSEYPFFLLPRSEDRTGKMGN